MGRAGTGQHIAGAAPEDAPYTGGLTFALRNYQVRHDGSQILRAAGLYRGETVGIDIRLGSDWNDEPSLAGTILAIRLGSVTFHSLGTQSDALVRLLGRLYRTEQQAVRMRPGVAFIGVALGGDPANLGAGTTRIKVSHEAGDNDDYFDLFAFIDLPSGLVQLREGQSLSARSPPRLHSPGLSTSPRRAVLQPPPG